MTYYGCLYASEPGRAQIQLRCEKSRHLAGVIKSSYYYFGHERSYAFRGRKYFGLFPRSNWVPIAKTRRVIERVTRPCLHRRQFGTHRWGTSKDVLGERNDMRAINSFRLVTTACVLLAFSLFGHAAISGSASNFQSSPSDRTPYLGTWQREVSDSTGTTRITLELRGNGSYTKNLDAVLKGREFHGADNGTWSADGPVVHCSGDGDSPPSNHDLRYYQKVR